MVSFEGLPYDIRFRVVETMHDNIPSLCALRLVSKSLNQLAVIFLFSKFEFSHTLDDLERCYEILAGISAKKSSLFASTRHIDVKMCLSGGPLEQVYAKPWFELWEIMLPGMMNLQSLDWIYWPSESYPPKWINDFIKALSSRTTLSDITIHLGNSMRTVTIPPELSLQPLRGLRTVAFHWYLYKGLHPELVSQISSLLGRCPTLEHFEFVLDIPISSHQNLKPEISLTELFEGLLNLETPLKLRRLVTRGVVVHPEVFYLHLRHLRYLRELTLEMDPSPNAPDHLGEICSLLQKEDIYLKSLFITTLHHPSILRYISSVSELENFSLQSFDPLDDSPALIDQFFTSLSQHGHSLKSLKLDINRKSSWPQALAVHFQKEAGRYRALRVLCSRVYLSLEDVVSGRVQVLASWLESFTELPTLQELECPHVSYKRGTYYFKRNSDDLMVHGPLGPCVHRFVLQVVEDFRRSVQPKFIINARQFT